MEIIHRISITLQVYYNLIVEHHRKYEYNSCCRGYSLTTTRFAGIKFLDDKKDTQIRQTVLGLLQTFYKMVKLVPVSHYSNIYHNILQYRFIM